MNVRLEKLATLDCARYDAYVARHPRGSFAQFSGHLAALEAGTGYRVRVALADDLRGLLPYVVTRGGRRLSLPFYEPGGPLLTDDGDTECLDALLAAAGRPELRLVDWTPPGQPAEPIADYAVLDLDGEVERRFDRQVHKALRKAAREGVRVVRVTAPETLVRLFVPDYLDWMHRRHGTPALSRRYWSAVATGLAGRWQLFVAWWRGRPVAQLLGFAVGQSVCLTQIVSDPTAWELRAVDAVHAAFIAWAAAAGLRRFEFGTMRYAGQRQYKLKWGCRRVTWARVGGGPPPAPESAAALLVRAAWRRLPGPVCERLGPVVREWLTW